MPTTQFQLESRSDLRTLRLGQALAKLLEPGDVVAMTGSLGAGKTQLVRGIAVGLDVSENLVSSPTFVLMNEYPGRLPVVHIDAYRLADMEELDTIGWSPELLEEAVTLVEWADRIEAELPRDYLKIDLEHIAENTRELHFTGHGRWAQRLGEAERTLTAALKTVSCPVCKRTVEQDVASFPFCSSRCRMVDLNKWFTEDYRISRPAEEQDFDDHF
ncbi:MAG: tRNA (adenosine(37)-N6)-threonylcarbamoyltransferase complex ATPase subunit type 1 TsaE [Phycisphaeraceae bacterium]